MKLIDAIAHLDAVEDSDPFNSMEIYAEGGADAGPGARALICAGDEQGSWTCPQDRSLRSVLMVQLARDAIEVWSNWRDGKVPGPRDKYEAVIHYARHDAYLPTEENP